MTFMYSETFTLPSRVFDADALPLDALPGRADEFDGQPRILFNSAI